MGRRQSKRSEVAADLQEDVVLEQRQIVEILAEVRGSREELVGLKGQMRDLRTVLMGAGDHGETQFGRLPMVERQLAALEREVALLKEMRLTAHTYWSMAAVAGHLLTACGGGIVVALCDWALKMVVR